MARCLRASHLLLAESLSPHGPELPALGQQNLNQIALGLDRGALFHDKHGHETVRDHEQKSKQRKQTVLLLWDRNRHHRCATTQGIQLAPHSLHDRQIGRMQIASQWQNQPENVEFV
jgi:hypothetical protein